MPLRVDHLLQASPKSAECMDGCLAAACGGLKFDFAEVWKREPPGGTKVTCIRQYFAATASKREARSVSSSLNPAFLVKRKLGGNIASKTSQSTLSRLVSGIIVSELQKGGSPSLAICVPHTTLLTTT